MRPTQRPVLPLLIAVLLAMAGSYSCSEGRGGYPPPRLVLLYATCTLNASYLSPFNSEVEFTPALRRFAKESLVFERHTTEAGQSGIAFASIFSGTQADHHQMYRHPLIMNPSVYLISEAYAEQGYDTFVWNAHTQIPAANGYFQGIPREQQYWGIIRPRGKVFAGILKRLREDPEYRAFVTTSFTYTHSPYPIHMLEEFLAKHPSQAGDLTIEEIRSESELHTANHLGLSFNHAATVEKLGLSAEELKRLYRAIATVYSSAVYRVDRHFGRVVQAIRSADLLDESLIVFTADHGEVVDRENARYPWSHAMQLAPEVLRVPLIIRAPQLGVETGTFPAVTRSIDVFPTMAGLSGIDLSAHPEIQGVDLSNAIRGLEPAPHLLGLSHTSVLVRAVHEGMLNPEAAGFWGELQANTPDQDVRRIWARIRDGDMVYKRYRLGEGEWQHSVFDLAKDPEERVDLFDPENLVQAEMVQRLHDYWEHLVRSYRAEGGAKSLLPEDERKALRALGYIE